jgi:uncharacterized membrane protein
LAFHYERISPLYLDRPPSGIYHARMRTRVFPRQRTNKESSPAFLALMILLLFASSCTRQPSYSPAPQNGSNIEIDISLLEPEIPKFFTYFYNGKKISYLVLKVDDKVSSFFDACASCYPHKMGYSYSNGYVTCRYCNLRFSVYKLEKGLGSCYPIKLEGKTVKGKYLIPVKTLEEAADMF